MFPNSRARLVLHKSFNSAKERRESPRYDVILGLQGDSSVVERCYGVLSLGGCDFDTGRVMKLGEQVRLRIYLLGMGKGIDLHGRVVRLSAPNSPGLAARVVVRFDSLAFDSERLIARWLDLVSDAYRSTAAA